MTNQGSDIRNELHTLTVGNIKPTQIETAGDKLYFSLDSMDSQLDIQEIVDTYRAVHCPTYGQVIPYSITIANKNATNTDEQTITTALLDGKMYELIAVDFQNEGAGTAVCDFGLSDGGTYVRVGKTGTIPATGRGELSTSGLGSVVYFNSFAYPVFYVTSGTPGDITCNMVYAQVVQ